MVKMLIHNVDIDDIERAFLAVNRVYSDNVTYKRFDWAGKNKDGNDKYNVALTVNDSAGPGGRRSPKGRRIAAACWHVFGVFYDSLPDQAVIVAWGRKFSAGDPWLDTRKGSPNRPSWYSDLCECDIGPAAVSYPDPRGGIKYE
jgi:hypothetical protein